MQEDQSIPAMECTAVVVHIPNDPTGRTKATASVVLNGLLQLNELRVVDGANGPFVAYPWISGEFRSFFLPVTREQRDCIETAVLAEYQRELSKENDNGV